MLPVREGALSSTAQPASSGGYASIYSFAQSGKANDGSRPSSKLISLDGALYGTTAYGGTTSAACSLGCGTVFRVTPAGTETVIYRFKGGNDGANPVARLAAVNGAVMGTTIAGGTASGCYGGCGTVFKLSADGKSEKILHSFTGGKDGAEPVAGLLQMNGAFYGTTQQGGTTTNLCTTGCGTVFKIAASGGESVLYRFKGRADGAYPSGGLLALQGDLYGTTAYGGTVTRFCATGCGTIFKISSAGAKTTLHAFKYGVVSDGAYPQASLAMMGGTLYGTTSGGGEHGNGSVFSASASSGAVKILHSFQCCSVVKDGSHPLSALTVVRGGLYGTTRDGGNHNKGTVFVVTTSSAESLLYQFAGQPDGQGPQAGLTLLAGKLYGTTTNGGSASLGTVFRVVP